MKRNFGNIGLVFMIVITAVTQVFTLIKSSVVAAKFGATNTMDAFNLANSISTFLFGFISAGISTIIIPEYANKRNKKEVDTFITVIYFLILIAAGSVMIFREQTINLFSNRDETFVNLAAKSLSLLLLFQYLSSIANITVAYFQCEGKYNIPKILNLISQLIVVTILIYVDNISIIEYIYIIGAGIALNFVADTAIALKCGWRFKPALNLTEDSKVLLRRFVPIVFSSGIYNVSLMLDSTIAALLETGKITILGYSSQISTMVNAIVITNLLVYIYPKLTKSINEEGYQNLFWKQTIMLHAVVCLMIAGFLCVGQEVIEMLFHHGAFTFEASKMVYYGASIYIVGQSLNILRNLIYRYFYALGDTKTPAKNSVLISVLNITISLILVKLIGFYGIILGTVLASLFSLVFIMVRFGKKIGYSEKITAIIGKYLLNFLITAATVGIVLLTKELLLIQNEVVSILVFGLETVVIYSLFQLLLNRKIVYTIKTF